MKTSFLTLSAALLFSGTVFAQSEIYRQHFNLEEIELLEGPFKSAQDLNIQLLLSYDANRLLTPFVRQSGLSATTDKNNPYYQWEQKHPNHENWGSGSFRLDGHVGGHYLSALALAYAASHNTEERKQLLAKIDYVLPILKDCQDAFKNDQTGLYGYLGGQPINEAWQSLYTGKTDSFRQVRGWVPFYCEHKVLAGLRDIALYTTDDKQCKRASLALEMFRKLSDWSVNVVANLSDADLQHVLDTEHGGMNETLVDAYRMFGDNKYLKAAKRYSHQTMVQGMQEQSETFLDGKHANTQVPKYIGFARIAQEDASANDYQTAAVNFWNDVTQNRTVCIGGNSVNEHFFGKAYGTRYLDETNGPESCNSNNMLKLSEDLFDSFHDAKYADFYESTMYNHILSTQDPETGGYVYFTPLRPQSYRIYSKVDQDMWCCVGTGMENHSKYGHFIYTHKGDSVLYVNLFTASKLTNKHFALTQKTQFPTEQGSTLMLNKGGKFTIAIRKPQWVAEGFSVLVNNQPVEVSEVPASGYVRVERKFKKGDVIEVKLPMSLRCETCPNLPDYIAFKYGPLLLAARTTSVSPSEANQANGLLYEALPHEYALGERMGHAPDSYAPKRSLGSMPMLIGQRSEVLKRVQPTEKPLVFKLDVTRTDTSARQYAWKELLLEPFYQLHHSRVNVYWYQQTYEQYLQSTWAQAEVKAQQLEARTLDRVDVGQQQAEAGVVTYSADSENGTYNGEDYRHTQANGWIQIELQNPEATTAAENAKLSLVMRFASADRNRSCSLYVNGQLLQKYTLPTQGLKTDGNGFCNVEFPLGNLAFDAVGKPLKQLSVRLVASDKTMNPGLYYVRLVKE